MKKFLLALLSLAFCVGSMDAGIETYFKKAKGKESYQGIRNIDFIYTINLDQRPEKFASNVKELEPYGIVPYRFSAVNGWELTLADLNKLGVKYKPGMKNDLWGTSYLEEDEGQPRHEIMSVVDRNYFCHCMTRGAIGIVLSHMSILQDAYDSGYDTIWVMEDDIQVIRDPNLLSSLIDELDDLVGRKKWDILFTDRDTKDQKGNYIQCLSYARKPDFDPPSPERFSQRKKWVIL